MGTHSYFANAQGQFPASGAGFSTAAVIPRATSSISAPAVNCIELAANYYYNNGYFFSVGHEFRQTAYSMVGASLQFTTADERRYARIWGANLGNTQAYASGSIQTDSTAVVLDAPRTYGTI